MKSFSREIIALLKRNDWEEVAVRGYHHQFKHPVVAGRA
jgi:predicted RNA binding protein YcfA (HicA-like mRNA interferase family)